MRVGDSFGEACRYCGSTTIIVSPPSSCGQCAVCSEQAIAWRTRLVQAAERRDATARVAQLAAAVEARATERAQRWERVNARMHAARARFWAERRAALTRAGAQARAAAASLVREVQFRGGRPSQA